jgi:cytochrome c556
MKRNSVTSPAAGAAVALAAGALAVIGADGAAGPAAAQQPSAGEGPGWTGLTKPKEVIAAREALMTTAERLMEPIDSLEVAPQDPDVVRAAARNIADIMLAVPHLFPPTTNLYDPKAQIPETLALPTIWQSFPSFYELAAAASAAAKKLSETRGVTELHDAGDALRDTCDACHAPYLRPYVPSKVTPEDLNFDFGSVLQNTK